MGQSSNSSHFVVLMMGGSVGSVWLQKLLSSHPLIHCDGELFNSKPLSEFRSWAAASSSAAAVGTRIKFTDLQGQLNADFKSNELPFKLIRKLTKIYW